MLGVVIEFGQNAPALHAGREAAIATEREPLVKAVEWWLTLIDSYYTPEEEAEALEGIAQAYAEETVVESRLHAKVADLLAAAPQEERLREVIKRLEQLQQMPAMMRDIGLAAIIHDAKDWLDAPALHAGREKEV